MNLSKSAPHVAAALRYAASDKSDPFAFARAMTHLGQGLADPDNYYDAEPATETRRTERGESYEVTVYRSIKRV